jgi:hypothetical protein
LVAAVAGVRAGDVGWVPRGLKRLLREHRDGTLRTLRGQALDAGLRV